MMRPVSLLQPQAGIPQPLVLSIQHGSHTSQDYASMCMQLLTPQIRTNSQPREAFCFASRLDPHLTSCTGAVKGIERSAPKAPQTGAEGGKLLNVQLPWLIFCNFHTADRELHPPEVAETGAEAGVLLNAQAQLASYIFHRKRHPDTLT